jgi:hypothetical protein
MVPKIKFCMIWQQIRSEGIFVSTEGTQEHKTKFSYDKLVTLKMIRSDQGDGTAELVCNFDAPHPLAM